MRRRARGWAGALLALALLVGACSGNDDDDSGAGGGDTPQPSTTSPEPTTSSTTRARSTTTEPTPSLADVDVRLTQVAEADAPTALAFRNGDTALYLAERAGRVVAVRDGDVDPTPVVDISDEVSSDGERGLLGLAFSPDGSRIYLSYTNLDGDSRIIEFRMREGRADAGSRRQILAVDQPFPNHNGGNILFGPDGFLYFGLGDGGSQGDPNGNAQNVGTLLGDILRIDPLHGDPYAIPAGNPHLGEANARGEVFVSGVRNPWRFSFDRSTGDLWIGDVGGSQVEEIDRVPAGHIAGANLGWNLVEGTRRLNGDPPPGAIPPVFEYDHSRGRAVTGGYVYRGSRIPALRGAYLFGDFYEGVVRGLVTAGGRVVDERPLGPEVEQLVSFAQDPRGELYVVSMAGPVYRLDP